VRRRQAATGRGEAVEAAYFALRYERPDAQDRLAGLTDDEAVVVAALLDGGGFGSLREQIERQFGTYANTTGAT
jgi:hypothetical protein